MIKACVISVLCQLSTSSLPTCTCTWYMNMIWMGLSGECQYNQGSHLGWVHCIIMWWCFYIDVQIVHSSHVCISWLIASWMSIITERPQFYFNSWAFIFFSPGLIFLIMIIYSNLYGIVEFNVLICYIVYICMCDFWGINNLSQFMLLHVCSAMHI